MEERQIIEKLLNLIYPPVCGICDKINNTELCKKCEIILNKMAIYGIDDYTKDNEKYFDKHIYIFMYEDLIRKIILNYKFGEKSYIYKTFSIFLLKNEKIIEILKNYDIIIPVPISKNRKKERGYNQSYLIAKEISKNIDIYLNNKCLEKVKNIVAQSTLTKEERNFNIKGAYNIKSRQDIENKKIIIFDDIYTTGSTVNECCKLLKRNGAKDILVLTLAKD